jgi:hypothetical protein
MLPDQAFRPIYNVRAYSIDYIINHLNDVGAFGLPYPGANELEAVETSVTTLVYLPSHYVPFMLNPSGYSLRQLWEILYPAVVDADDLDACAALLKWMRVVTMSVVQNNLPGPTGAAVELHVPLADENLIAHFFYDYSALYFRDYTIRKNLWSGPLLKWQLPLRITPTKPT